MTSEAVLAMLRARRSELSAYGVQSLAVFGSVARGTASAQSDVDLLVQFAPGARVGLFRFLELKEYLEGILGRDVDLVTPAALRPGMRERILNEAVDVAA